MTTGFEEKRFDLHTHSTFSDGTTTPNEIAQLAAYKKLLGFALTDHDTIEGWQEGRAAAKAAGVEFLPGIELTTSELMRSIHLLAYGTDPNDTRMLEELHELRVARFNRAKEMVRRISKDFDLDWEGVLDSEYNPSAKSLGRPHLADALVAAGYFSNRSEAFEKALSAHGPYYVPARHLGTIDAIKIVREAGGFPVLAHPAAFRMRRPIDSSVVDILAQNGLGGIELHHPENRIEWIPELKNTAQRLGLLITGASDFHGIGKPNKLGEKTSSAATVSTIRSQVATPR